ncbi:unnamed protein product [Linum trigynum]|uniref:F-box domain-containing protein n=1 Tax=Linum trigynum TaxID=586398 RepID=A0AAV2EKV2_9ROSI
MKGGKRRRGVKQTDRLSDLPNGILHHILSFLDSESVVRSNILSRRWVWKEVHVLNFYGHSCKAKQKQQHIERHVDQILSCRSDCNVRKISIFFDIQAHVIPYLGIVKYAASHGLQQLYVLHKEEDDRFLILSADVALISTYVRSLKVLDLQWAVLDESALGFWSHLKLLETLTLRDCEFDFGGPDNLPDPLLLFSDWKT